MQSFVRTGFALCATLAALGIGTSAFARPSLRVMPPTRTGFLVDQRFDVRVEFTPSANATLTNVSLSIDGGANLIANVNALDATRGFTIRQFAFQTPGVHTITAIATDTADNVAETRTVTLNVTNPFGNRRRVRNIIFLLGDGMGAGHKTAARIVKHGVIEGRANGMLAMDMMPGVASINTHSLNSIVTDSAPGMGTFVTGSKSINNQEGVYPDNTGDAAVAGNNTGSFDNPRVEYLSEYLKRKFNKVTGIVSTADIEDATPAANAVHTQRRAAGTGICDQYFDERNRSGLKVLLGGGRRWFLPNTVPGSARSAANDYNLNLTPYAQTLVAAGIPSGAIDPGRNLINDFTGAGFTYAASKTDMFNPDGTIKPAFANSDKILGLFAFGNMNVALDKINGRRGTVPVINGNPRATTVVQDFLLPDQPMLDEMTDVALNALNKNRDGFFLMVEAAHIDKQSHAMDADRAIYDTLEFDRAVQKCLEFANRVGDTLVVLTADHECSGFSIIGGINTQAALNAPSDAGTLSPSTEPERQKAAVIGIYEGAGFPDYGAMLADGFPLTPDPARKLAIGFGGSGDRYEDWIAEPVPFNDGIATNALAAGTLTDPPYRNNVTLRQPESDRGMFLRGQATGSGRQAVHIANEVPFYAFSTSTPGTQSNVWMQFKGTMDNSDIFFLLGKAAGGGY